MNSLLITTPLSMTSREVAKLTGKRHDNVLRDIDNLLETISSELSAGFSMTYEGNPVYGYRYFIMDRDSSYCLITGYDATARMKIIKRWQELEAKQSVTTPQASTTPPPFKPSFATNLQRYKNTFVVTTIILADLLGYESSYLLQVSSKVDTLHTNEVRAVLTETQLSSFMLQLLSLHPLSLHPQDSNIMQVFNTLILEFKHLHQEYRDYQSTTPAACPDFHNPVVSARAWATAEEGRLEEGAARIAVTQEKVKIAQKLEQTSTQLQAALPAVQFHAQVGNTTQLYSVDATAKLLNLAPFYLRTLLKQLAILREDGLPYQKYLNQKLVQVKILTLPNHLVYHQPLFTGKGLSWLHKKLTAHGIVLNLVEVLQSPR